VCVCVCDDIFTPQLCDASRECERALTRRWTRSLLRVLQYSRRGAYVAAAGGRVGGGLEAVLRARGEILIRR